MSTESKGTEFFAGLFVLIGLVVIAAMIIIFGRVGSATQKSYPLVVEFPNASGIVKGSDVLLSGARVGTVTQSPKLLGNAYAVATNLSIDEGVQIPRNSNFYIRTNGMLGDSYVDIAPPVQFTPGDFFAAGETAMGSKTGGFDELTAKGGVMMDTLNQQVLLKLSAELDQIKIATTAINEKLLSQQNLKNLEATFANLKTATESFATTSKNLDAVAVKAGTAVEAATATMKSVDTTTGDLRLAIGDVRKVADSARGFIYKATNGDGALGTLVSDKKTADDLKNLIANLRRSGVLFYKDRPLVPAPTIPPAKRH